MTDVGTYTYVQMKWILCWAAPNIREIVCWWTISFWARMKGERIKKKTENVAPNRIKRTNGKKAHKNYSHIMYTAYSNTPAKRIKNIGSTHHSSIERIHWKTTAIEFCVSRLFLFFFGSKRKWNLFSFLLFPLTNWKTEPLTIIRIEKVNRRSPAAQSNTCVCKNLFLLRCI